MVIRRIGVWSVARMYGALMAAMGLLVGLVVALFSMVGAGMSASSDVPAWIGPVMGVGAIIVLPLFYGVMGLCMGAVGAALYNLFAAMVGGISIEVDS